MANHGLKNQWHTVFKDGKPKREITERGENYRVCCPFCNDTRHRCYVSYEFGTADLSGRTDLYLINCYNEECFTYVPSRRELFFFDVLFGRPVCKMFVKQGKIRQPGEYTSPGITIPLHELAKDHIAVSYLHGRGFNVPTLSYLYKMSWCCDSKFKYARNRIVMPVIANDKEIGWLARAGVDENIEGPKYFNMPGFVVQKNLYNFDTAKRYRTIILVEGVLDCVRVGPLAIALLGKSLSTYNADRLAAFATRNEVTVVVALDPERPKNDRSSKHPIEIVVSKLARRQVKAMPLYLPVGSDPASVTRSYFRELLYKSAEEQDIELNFSQINQTCSHLPMMEQN